MNIKPVDFFSALGNESRLRCLLLMMRFSELCVCELNVAIGLPQPSLSRHLGNLRDLGLVLDRRQGQWVYYRVHPELPPWAHQLLQNTADNLASFSPFADDAVAVSGLQSEDCVVSKNVVDVQ